ncbi:hypothetical protein JCGZ_25412 [Jatropha curcas]|uniref:No apical meristem-associated C-terminal domain-containing protein n=1 Tax=Jatropha curcas TaxID=180498 RepID=A0A067JLD9_JATCU|nr:hypothetical protein JCGZ_25412 [Jatropha curcas]
MGGEYHNARNTNSLGCRWGKIQAAVNKFHGFYERLERHPQSRTTPEDMKQETMRMYEDVNNGQVLKYEHCWELMVKNPKWCSKGLTKTKSNKFKSNVIKKPPPLAPTKHESYSNEGDRCTMNNTAAKGINVEGAIRPEGRKKLMWVSRFGWRTYGSRFGSPERGASPHEEGEINSPAQNSPEVTLTPDNLNQRSGKTTSVSDDVINFSSSDVKAMLEE